MTRTTLAALFLVGCSNVPNATPDDVVSRTDLSELGGLAGVTVEPDTGRRLVLDDLGQISVVDADGAHAMVQRPPQGWEFTDMVAVGDGVVALTAQSNGYLFDTKDGTFTQHFCYEPDWEQPQQDYEFQITYALAYDSDSGLLVAQPHTAMTDTPNAPTASYVATYDRASGADLAWYTMPQASYRAGGMAIAAPGEYWLGVDGHLDRFEADMDRPERFASLTGADIRSIAGLAIDDAAGTLLVVDEDSQLVEIRLDSLER